MLKATHTLYVDIVGQSLREFDQDPAQHAEYLTDTVCTLLRGMGLARRSGSQAVEGFWPGSASRSGIDEYGTMQRVGVDYEVEAWAKADAKTLADFLLANAWDESVLAVFVATQEGSFQTVHEVHGKARSFLELHVYCTA